MMDRQSSRSGKSQPQSHEAPPKHDDDVKNAAVQRHVDYIDLAERVSQGITVVQEIGPADRDTHGPVRKRPPHR
jgi:hypothetical protein